MCQTIQISQTFQQTTIFEVKDFFFSIKKRKTLFQRLLKLLRYHTVLKLMVHMCTIKSRKKAIPVLKIQFILALKLSRKV